MAKLPIKVLEQAIEKVRSLSSDRQAYVAHVLEEIAAETDSVYRLTDEERELVREGLAELDRGEHASDSDSEPMPSMTWLCSKSIRALPRHTHRYELGPSF